MKSSAMPEVKFAKRERPQTSDAEIVAELRLENQQLLNKVDELRELLDERNARIAELGRTLTAKVTPNAFEFAQHVALDGVVTQENVVYLAHYVQVLMDEYEQRIAELEHIIAVRAGLVRKPQPRLDDILQTKALNVEADGDVIYA